MTIKCLAAGNVFGYFMSPRNYKGEERELEPRWLMAEPRAAMDLLEQIAPPHVKKSKKLRWLGHCRRNMSHLIVGFKEGHYDAQWALGCAVRATECLVLAGLPRASLEFAWCYHPQSENTHLHCGLMRSLLPGGGNYAPRLPFGLAVDFGWLVSWRLKLDLPINRAAAAARLVHGGEFSYKNENRGCIKKICEATREHFRRNSQGSSRLSTHQDFLGLLEQHREELGIGKILVVPNKEGYPVRLTSDPIGRVYRRSVAVQGPKTIIWLQGPVCRPDFNLADWEHKFENQLGRFAHPEMVFNRFQRRLQARIDDQRARYRIGRSASEVVDQRHFDWLNPNGPLGAEPIAGIRPDLLGLDMALPRFSIPEPWGNPLPSVTEFVEYGPDPAYPFYSDPDDLEAAGAAGLPEAQADHDAHFQAQELEQTDITGLPAGFDDYPDDDLDEGCFWPFPSWEKTNNINGQGPLAGNPANKVSVKQDPAVKTADNQPEIANQTGVKAPETVPPSSPNSGHHAQTKLSAEATQTAGQNDGKEGIRSGETRPVAGPSGQDPDIEKLKKEKRRWRRNLQLEISGEMVWKCQPHFQVVSSLTTKEQGQTEQKGIMPGSPLTQGGPQIEMN